MKFFRVQVSGQKLKFLLDKQSKFTKLQMSDYNNEYL